MLFSIDPDITSRSGVSQLRQVGRNSPKFVYGSQDRKTRKRFPFAVVVYDCSTQRRWWQRLWTTTFDEGHSSPTWRFASVAQLSPELVRHGTFSLYQIRVLHVIFFSLYKFIFTKRSNIVKQKNRTIWDKDFEREGVLNKISFLSQISVTFPINQSLERWPFYQLCLVSRRN